MTVGMYDLSVVNGPRNSGRVVLFQTLGDILATGYMIPYILPPVIPVEWSRG